MAEEPPAPPEPPEGPVPPGGPVPPEGPELRTPRLLLRPWQPEDEAPMAAVNSHPEVARLLNRPADQLAVAGFYAAMRAHWRRHGFGPWAVESLEASSRGDFLGVVGLAHVPPYLAAAGPEPELGWRLAPAAWGRGLATEAATAARDDAFSRLALERLISIIHPDNTRSQRVAEKLGMRRDRQIHNPAIGREVDVWALERPGA